jgi:hypothetical protein
MDYVPALKTFLESMEYVDSVQLELPITKHPKHAFALEPTRFLMEMFAFAPQIIS